MFMYVRARLVEDVNSFYLRMLQVARAFLLIFFHTLFVLVFHSFFRTWFTHVSTQLELRSKHCKLSSLPFAVASRSVDVLCQLNMMNHLAPFYIVYVHLFCSRVCY